MVLLDMIPCNLVDR